ncbi:hypothetical protein AB835_10555 [Candidatus Endobugula sertula]|uniref:Lipopolysaccharide assembly protein B n=1 Tax=Candidatus Endobugula sertula TaxID=62101 RepID=A0A1D2QNC5_9GAMM|nr:hypothetical protein AB835_10555 [Candidatus Endobugula sertula]
MVDWALYIALVISLALGFLGGYRSAKSKPEATSNSLDGNYFKGLNFLLNEQPDAAIDAFIQALEVNSDTLETHLALGKLLRKQGEVDRAIRIHQNLLARPGLNQAQTHQAQYELATDFVKSGLLDRAEGLLEELVTKEGPYKTDGLKCLLEVYRDEKEWKKGLDVLQQLSGSRFSRSYKEWAPTRAHFCCEMAELDLQAGNYFEARRWLKQALAYDRQSVRAGLLLGLLDINVGQMHKGIDQLQKLIYFHHDYTQEIIPYLTDAYQKLGQSGEYRQFLSALYAKSQDVVVLMTLTDLIEQEDSKLAAAEYIAGEVVKYPSGMGLHRLLEYYLFFSEGKTKEYLLSLKIVMEKVIGNGMYYQCYHCGFKGKQLHWLCPSCKHWGSLKSKKAVADAV